MLQDLSHHCPRSGCLLWALTGFLRCEELLKLVCADVQFNQERLVMSIKSSKTDHFREGASLVVARTGARTCPVEIMERYFRMGHLSGGGGGGGSNDRVFVLLCPLRKVRGCVSQVD